MEARIYSGTPLNRHPSMADSCDITDISECPDHISMDFNTFKTPQVSIRTHSLVPVVYVIEGLHCMSASLEPF